MGSVLLGQLVVVAAVSVAPAVGAIGQTFFAPEAVAGGCRTSRFAPKDLRTKERLLTVVSQVNVIHQKSSKS